MNRTSLIVILAFGGLLWASAGRGQECCGDCDSDRRVTVAELVHLVGISLRTRTTGSCDAGVATIDGLVCAVRSLLDGCPDIVRLSPTPVPPTPTPLPPAPTPTPTAKPTASPTNTPTGPGPDLAVESIRATHNGASSCGPFEALVVCIVNYGDRGSGRFRVDIAGFSSFTVVDLPSLDRECVWRSLTRSAGSSFTVTVDADDSVEETDEGNNVLTATVRWPTIRATCTATRTRTPTPPAMVARPLATADATTIWMTLIPCLQCGPCDLSLSEMIGLIGGSSSPDRYVPEDVEILDHTVRSVGVACAACDCPRSGSPIFEVLVRRTDVAAMRAAGWVAHR